MASNSQKNDRCWCGDVIDAPGHPNPHHHKLPSSSTKHTHQQERSCDCSCHVTHVRTDTFVTVNTCPHCDQGPKDEPKKPGSGNGNEKIPEPPPGLPHDPWDIIKILGKICRGDKPPPRKDSFLPYLVVRANPGDRGQRPLPTGTVFWESPDIFVIPNQSTTSAPDVPISLGGMAQAGVPNTLFAHVWNLGRGPAYDIRVEFYWFNPTLGIEESDANLIGFTYVTLGSRNSPKSHRVVRCPQDWIPSFVNNGHECLVVRAFSPISDPVGQNAWNAAQNRHVGQRNITVLRGSQNITNVHFLKVAPGHSTHEAKIVTVNVDPGKVPWMQLVTGKRNVEIKAPAIMPLVGIMAPTVASEPESPRINLRGLSREALGQLITTQYQFKRADDPLEIALVTKPGQLGADEAHVVRVQQVHENEIVGGYTTIIMP
jgi:hypothetical protein